MTGDAAADVRAGIASILETSRRLRDQAAAQQRPELTPDLEKIAQAAQEFLGLMERSSDTPHLRHDLYGAVNNLVLYAEIVKEDVAALGVAQDFDEALSQVRSTALCLQAYADRLTEAAPPAAAADERPGTLGERTAGARILAVDDDAESVAYLGARLARLGYDVTTAICGEEALRLIGEQAFDVVLLDIMMPKVRGDQVLRTLRKRVAPSAVSVIMVTARDHSADVVAALRDGANDYVTKPMDFPVLLARIETQLSLRRLSALKEEFCAIASHDIRGLLTTMLAAAHVLEQDAAGEAREHVRTLRGCCLEMNGVIEDFLGFDAMEHGRLALDARDLDLAALLRNAVETHREYARSKSIQLSCEVAEPLRVLGDGTRLGQVVRNLLNNAVKFTPRGGVVEIRGRVEDGAACIEVQDSGRGLSEDDRMRLFRRNTRLSCDPTGGEAGSGLGLYISKRLVELHGGEIGADNRSGGGSTFWFKIPRP